MTSPTRATTDGRAYLDLRKKARQDHRPVDELMQLYVLECFLARLAGTRFARQFVLKGGVLLAAFGERRPTRDIDLQAQDFDSEPATILAAITEIAAEDLDDGVIFDTSSATTEVIREEDHYSGVRVSIAAQLATARPRLHVDVSVGDPISPEPANVTLPRVLGGEIIIRGYPLAMVHAEKIVTAISRGTTSTRWRDFADIYLLARHHALDGDELSASIREVARHRGTNLVLPTSLFDHAPAELSGDDSAGLRGHSSDPGALARASRAAADHLPHCRQSCGAASQLADENPAPAGRLANLRGTITW